MPKQPTVSTDSVAQDQIRAFVERILRMKEEAKAINDDIREIYAEAKGNGFDKTVLGKVVSYVEKRGKDSNAVAEQDALFDLYLEAFDGGPSRTHAHAREDDDEGDTDSRAKVSTGNAVNAKARHGEGGTDGSGETSRLSEGSGTLASHSEPASASPEAVAADVGSDPADEAEEATGQDASSAPHPVANVEEEANGAIAAASADPASREGDDAEPQQLAPSGFTEGVEAAPPQSVRDAAEELGTGAASTKSEPDHGEAGETPAGAGAPAAVGTAHHPIPVAVPSSRDGLYSFDWLRRHGRCQDPDGCDPKPGKVCITCSRAMAVVPATAHIPHERPVA